MDPPRQEGELWHTNSGCLDLPEEMWDRFLITAKRLVSASSLMKLFDVIMDKEIESGGPSMNLGHFDALEYCNQRSILTFSQYEAIPTCYRAMIDYAHHTYLDGDLYSSVFSVEE